MPVSKTTSQREEKLARKLLGFTLSVFAAITTLLGCTLPALMVILGMGAVIANNFYEWPWAVVIVEYREWFFAIGAFLLASAIFFRWQSVDIEADDEAAAPQEETAITKKDVRVMDKLSLALVVTALFTYITAFFFLYIATPLLY